MGIDAKNLRKARMLYEAREAPEAVALVRKLLEKEPKNPEYLINLSLYLRAAGDFKESFEALERVPDDMPGRAMLAGWHLLREGRFLEGSRVRGNELNIIRVDARFHFPEEKRLPAGESVKGKRIFFALEGGNGDEIAYVRFVPELKKRGAKVIVGCSNEVLPIISRARDVEESCPVSAISHDQYDFYIRAMDVVSLLDIEHPSTNVQFPYISTDTQRVNGWKRVLDNAASGKLKIGIQWQGNTEFEHIEFKTFPAALLTRFADLGQLFSLQRKESTRDNLFPADVPLFDTQTGVPDWEDTLACIYDMDIVIAGDTTITHLAGALGKPAILFIPHAPHPYWADLQPVSMWYPSVRVFRQPTYNDWTGAILDGYGWLEKNRQFM